MLEKLQDGFQNALRKLHGTHVVSEKNIRDVVDEVKDALLEADVNVRVVRRFVNQTIETALGEQVLKSVSPSQMFIKLLYDTLCNFLGNDQQDIHLQGNPAVILMCGLQGSGKTTTCAKLAKQYKANGKNVAMAAADIVRPAAVEQLQILGKNIQVPVYHVDKARSTQQVAEYAHKKAKHDGIEVLIVDSAGRTELDEAMLKEISAMNRTLKSTARILVVDALTGQTAVQVAKSFNEAVSLTGLIFSKVDSDARGGALLSVKTVVDVPVHYIGTGEGIDELDVFHPDRIASRILGMGDVVSMVEKVQEHVDEKKAEELHQKIVKKTFTLQDYLDQFQQIKSMGSLEKVAEMLPGVTASQLQQIDHKQITREEAIILSMTKRERENAKILGPTRKTRVARGSGTSVAQVNMLLKKFEKTKTMMKKTIKNKKYQAQFLQNIGHMPV